MSYGLEVDFVVFKSTTLVFMMFWIRVGRWEQCFLDDKPLFFLVASGCCRKAFRCQGFSAQGENIRSIES